MANFSRQGALAKRPRMRVAVVTALLSVGVGLSAAYAALAFLMLIGFVSEFAFGVSSEQVGLSPVPSWQLVLVPTLGGLLVGLLIQRILHTPRAQGPADVICEARGYADRLTPRAGLGSAVASILSIGVGASVGRYGPAVHLGACFGSAVARLLKLDDTRRRMLLASGAAAAIAASFNAPLAGVLFAHEVILGSFALRAVTPIVIASVVGTAVTRVHGGDVSLFDLPNQQIAHAFEYPLFALLGILGGYGAVAFMRVLSRAQSWGGQIPGPVWMRTAAGGFVLGLLALNFPQVLGLGESTIDAALHGDIALELLVALAIVKVLATSLSIGAGFSGGILGPALFVGAMLGAALGVALPELVPLDLSDISVYALAGMGAVISRVIGGPITTILIVFELTHSYSLTTAVMVAVVVASVIPSRRFSGSFFEHQLSAQGIDLSVGSEIMRLRTRTLESVLDPIFLSVDPHCSVDDARTIMANCPHDADLFLLDDAGRLLGSLRAAQLLDLAADTPVSTVASTTNLTLYRDTTIDEAMLSLADFVGVSVAVVDDPNSQKMLGIIHENALFTAYRDAIEDTRSSTK